MLEYMNGLSKVRIAARQLNYQLRINQLVGDNSWKPGVRIPKQQTVAKWKTTASKLQGEKAVNVLKLLQNNRGVRFTSENVKQK